MAGIANYLYATNHHDCEPANIPVAIAVSVRGSLGLAFGGVLRRWCGLYADDCRIQYSDGHDTWVFVYLCRALILAG